MGVMKYTELAKGRIKDSRNIVVSACKNEATGTEGYSVAEQLVAHEAERETKVFLRGGIGILTAEGLLNLYETIKTACVKAGLLEE